VLAKITPKNATEFGLFVYVIVEHAIWTWPISSTVLY